MRGAGRVATAAAIIAATVFAPHRAAAQKNLEPTAEILLAWRVDRVSVGTGRLSLTNNLGYRIELLQGYVADLSLELIPCQKFGEIFRKMIFGRAAHAGHSRFQSPNRLQHSRIEPIVPPDPARLGAFSPPDVRYCKAHYLVASAVAATEALPAAPDLRGLGSGLD